MLFKYGGEVRGRGARERCGGKGMARRGAARAKRKTRSAAPSSREREKMRVCVENRMRMKIKGRREAQLNSTPLRWNSCKMKA